MHAEKQITGFETRVSESVSVSEIEIICEINKCIEQIRTPQCSSYILKNTNLNDQHLTDIDNTSLTKNKKIEDSTYTCSITIHGFTP